MDYRDEFFDLYFKMNMGEVYKKEAMLKLKEIASHIPELKGWPEDKVKFWDAESYNWPMRFKKGEREFILETIKEHISSNHLDIASGALPVNSECVCLDFSKEMLDMIRTLQEKIVFDIDSTERLPFNDSKFDSVSCVFILNYIENLDFVISEINRILSENGKFIIVQSNKPLHELHRQKEKYGMEFEDKLMESLENNNFFVTVENHEYNNKELLILICEK